MESPHNNGIVEKARISRCAVLAGPNVQHTRMTPVLWLGDGKEG